MIDINEKLRHQQKDPMISEIHRKEWIVCLACVSSKAHKTI